MEISIPKVSVELISVAESKNSRSSLNSTISHFLSEIPKIKMYQVMADLLWWPNSLVLVSPFPQVTRLLQTVYILFCKSYFFTWVVQMLPSQRSPSTSCFCLLVWYFPLLSEWQARFCFKVLNFNFTFQNRFFGLIFFCCCFLLFLEKIQDFEAWYHNLS